MYVYHLFKMSAVANGGLYWYETCKHMYFLKYSLILLCTVFTNDGKVGERWEKTSICNCAKENTFIWIQGICTVLEIREKKLY